MTALPGMVRWCLITGVLLSFAVSCSEVGTAPSGMEGFVTIGPTCPEIRDAEPCERAPFEAKLVIKEPGSGREVTTVQSATDGTFRVELAPGKYIIEPAAQNQFVPPYADSQNVLVREGEFTRVEIAYDSGIR